MMLRLLIVCAVVLLEAYAEVDPVYIQKILKEVQGVGEKCAEEVKAAPEDLAAISDLKFPPSTHEGKCILACFYKHYKMMKEDGTFDHAAATVHFEDVKKMDPELYEKIIKVINMCAENEKILDDPCETASEKSVCIKDSAEKMGINKEAFLLKAE